MSCWEGLNLGWFSCWIRPWHKSCQKEVKLQRSNAWKNGCSVNSIHPRRPDFCWADLDFCWGRHTVVDGWWLVADLSIFFWGAQRNLEEKEMKIILKVLVLKKYCKIYRKRVGKCWDDHCWWCVLFCCFFFGCLTTYSKLFRFRWGLDLLLVSRSAVHAGNSGVDTFKSCWLNYVR